MPLNIVVCIKQVPDTNDMRIDPKTNNLIREGVPAVVNPTDLNAIEEALRFKDTFGATVRVMTMGPPQAEQSLREALAMGADEAYLLTDRAFGGADTLATSYALWKGVQKIEETSGKTDFIFFGKVAIDGETGQVGPGLAVRLGYPVITYTANTTVVDLENKFVEAERRVDDGVERVRGTDTMCINSYRSGKWTPSANYRRFDLGKKGQNHALKQGCGGRRSEEDWADWFSYICEKSRSPSSQEKR